MKLGLALSGGGFRASFFHIGVLARMAEIGKLRNVEVISTVSGGSIIGAMYYVKLKKLLDINASPSDQELIKLVSEIEEEFLDGVQKNIRMRTFINPLKNLRMAMANYSRSDRLAELYDTLFYRPVLNPGADEMIKMNELKIKPGAKDKDTAFGEYKTGIDDVKPIKYNEDIGQGGCKLPIILINATSLNSGHNWRFEASRMGEPERISDDMLAIDKNSRFSRPDKYDDMPTEALINIRLGHAVAASACVPGLFNPLAISNMYEDIQIQLVDGGVHDNQGIEALLEYGCKEVIISDASGQMGDELDQSAQIPKVVGRMSSVLMDRVREEELKSVLRNTDVETTLLHMRRGLTPNVLPYCGEKPPAKLPDISLEFGVHENIQDLLSKVRTDLDSFSDVEADALMLDGYLISKHCFDEKVEIVKGQWRFSHLTNLMEKPDEVFTKHLEIASKQFFKAFFLKPLLSTCWLLVISVPIVILIWTLLGESIQNFLDTSTTYGGLLAFVVITIASVALSRWKKLYKAIKLIRQPATFIGRLVVRAIPPALGSAIIWVHLRVFDRIFLKEGERENFTS